jgi:monofunctional biosynthetic peptidoglycan transglycosylase
MFFIFRILLKILLWFLIISIGSVIAFKWIPIPFTPFMIKRCVIQKTEGEEMKLKKDWVSLDEINNNLQLAVVCCEDQNFLKHHGFDFNAIKKAITENEEGKRLRGGSTISQQTAKNVFLLDGRNYIRKGFEAYFTFLIELIWGKERIIECYLNVIEFGNGIYGAEAAAQHYFRKSAKNLTKEESATLAVLLPNPRVYGKNLNGKYVQRRKSWALTQMSFWGNKFEFENNNEK